MEVNTDIITIKIKNGIPPSNAKRYGQIVVSNVLGFIDIKVPNKNSFFEFAEKLKSDKTIEAIFYILQKN